MKIVLEDGDEEWLTALIARAIAASQLPAGRSSQEEWMTVAEVSEHLRIAEGTLAYWRSTGKDGPPSVRRGRRVFYRRADVDAWMSGS